ncbi:unnamed protein product [Victoria cruziana]
MAQRPSFQQELAFERLRRYEIWGSLALGSATGHQQLSFMLPNIGANSIRHVPRIERLVLNNVPSLIHMKLVEDDHRIIFQFRLDIQRPVVKEDPIQEHLRVADHPTVLVSADTSNLTTIRMAFSFVGEDCEDTLRG